MACPSAASGFGSSVLLVPVAGAGGVAGGAGNWGSTWGALATVCDTFPGATRPPRYHSYAAAPTMLATSTRGISQRKKLGRVTVAVGSSPIVVLVECRAGDPSAGAWAASGMSASRSSASRLSRRA